MATTTPGTRTGTGRFVCAFFRPVFTQGHDLHTDLACGHCWRPCRNRVERDGDRCDACWEAIVSNPRAVIRAAAINGETTPPEWVLLRLATEEPDEELEARAGELLAEGAFHR